MKGIPSPEATLLEIPCHELGFHKSMDDGLGRSTEDKEWKFTSRISQFSSENKLVLLVMKIKMWSICHQMTGSPTWKIGPLHELSVVFFCWQFEHTAKAVTISFLTNESPHCWVHAKLATLSMSLLGKDMGRRKSDLLMSYLLNS